jgi:hypothetical protein
MKRTEIIKGFANHNIIASENKISQVWTLTRNDGKQRSGTKKMIENILTKYNEQYPDRLVK